MRSVRFIVHPLLLPIVFFALAIVAGSLVLLLPACLRQPESLSWLDALFTATSATCVTGLTVVDTGSAFTPLGQTIILLLIQVGGLGIMSLTSLAMYLFRKRVSLTDRVAVGQNLLQDPGFHLGRFLLSILCCTLVIEGVGAMLLFVTTGGAMGPAQALFHSVSAFCNAGFSLYSDSLSRWAGNVPVNLVFIGLIVAGGIGFFVLMDSLQVLGSRLRKKRFESRVRLSWYSRVILSTSLALLIVSALTIFLVEMFSQSRGNSLGVSLLTSLFQAVSCRTAGFNTVPVSSLTNATLLVMIILMFIGAAPGSCGGGIKVSTFRVLLAFLAAELRDREQSVIGPVAVSRESVRRALSLFAFSALIVGGAIFVLCVSETGTLSHIHSQGKFLEITFEAVSAFGTAGISMGLTPRLSPFGKCVIILLMFLGRLGPLIFVGALQALQKHEAFSRPESDLLIG